MKNDKGPYGLLIPGLHFQAPVTGTRGADKVNALTLAATSHLLGMHPPQKDPETGKPRPPELDTHKIIAEQLKRAMK
jgi:hypothetical protein